MDFISPHQRFGRERILRLLLCSIDHPAARVMHMGFALGAAAHLWLLDAADPAWMPANLLLLMGAALIAWRGALLGWMLSACGLIVPLVFLRDQLTQSWLLLAMASTAGIGTWVNGYTTLYTPEIRTLRAQRSRAANLFVVWSWRVLCVSTYLLAALHKFNRDYLTPETSCAVYGWREVLEYWEISWVAASHPALLTWLPHLSLVVEAGIAVCYLPGRRRLAWPLAILFHIPLTTTMAPAFAFVMLAAHTAFLEPEDLADFRDALARHWPWLLGGATALTALSLSMHGAWPEASMVPKEWLLWGLLLLCLTTYPPWTRRARVGRSPTSADTSKAPRARLGAACVAAVFWLNGLTPYTGVQYQHTAAMLSNLRIDTECWNSLVMPESLRLTDEYIRVDRAHFGAPRRLPEYEAVMTEHLWSPPQLRQMIRNWCPDTHRPFYLEGKWRGDSFVIEDLCAHEADATITPFDKAGVFGTEIFPDFLRFQKNLKRQCPQKCIH